MIVISKDEAKQKGLKKYFTGVECVNGHIAERSVSSRSCLECQKIYNKKQPKKKKQLTLEQRKKAALYSKEYHSKNREECLLKMKQRNEIYYQKNKEKIKNNVARYSKLNKAKVSEYKRKWQSDKKSDPTFKMTLVMRRMLQRALGVSGQKKYKNTRDYLPYSSEELVRHLESKFKKGMNWENYGEWHIDHIIPISYMIKNGITQPDKINALENLQPLWACENMSKGATTGL